MISAVRLKTLLAIELADFSGTGAIGVMFSALEPCLLITAACVPLLRPILGRKYSSTGTARVSNDTSSNSIGSGLRSGFLKLKDTSSLKRLRPDVVRYDATVVSKDATSEQNGEDTRMANGTELSAIRVKKDWTVQEGYAQPSKQSF